MGAYPWLIQKEKKTDGIPNEVFVKEDYKEKIGEKTINFNTITTEEILSFLIEGNNYNILSLQKKWNINQKKALSGMRSERQRILN